MSKSETIGDKLPGLRPELAAAVSAAVDSLLSAGRIRDDSYPSLPDIAIRRDPKAPLSAAIDHTLLKQTASADEYARLFREAAEWKVWSACIPPTRVAQAAHALAGSNVQVCTVIGFPFGYSTPEAKAREVSTALADGAQELDMVLQVGYVKDADWPAVFDDIAIVVAAAGNHLVKVILESGELTLAETAAASAVAVLAGTCFLKTSTGFAGNGAGADIEALKIMRHIAGDKRGVKASGGVRTREFALACIEVGADRIGASATGQILGLGAASGGY